MYFYKQVPDNAKIWTHGLYGYVTETYCLRMAAYYERLSYQFHQCRSDYALTTAAWYIMARDAKRLGTINAKWYSEYLKCAEAPLRPTPYEGKGTWQKRTGIQCDHWRTYYLD